MNAPAGRIGQKYQSDKIRARRSRILVETRQLLSEAGFAGFNIRTLCIRADIAEKTLYNAFGSKENVIAAAIREFLFQILDSMSYRFAHDTIDGYLERLLACHLRYMQFKAYTAATVVLYNAPSESPIRETIQALWNESLAPLVSALEGQKGFAIGVTSGAFVHTLSFTTFAVTSEWCLGAIADEDYIDRLSEVSLIVIAGCCRGAAAAQARRWLEDLRRQRAGWIGLRKLAELAAEGAVDDSSARQADALPRPGKTRRRYSPTSSIV